MRSFLKRLFGAKKAEPSSPAQSWPGPQVIPDADDGLSIGEAWLIGELASAAGEPIADTSSSDADYSGGGGSGGGGGAEGEF